jgi:hypothetical protein
MSMKKFDPYKKPNVKNRPDGSNVSRFALIAGGTPAVPVSKR